MTHSAPTSTAPAANDNNENEPLSVSSAILDVMELGGAKPWRRGNAPARVTPYVSAQPRYPNAVDDLFDL